MTLICAGLYCIPICKILCKFVATPIQAQGNFGDGKRAMILLKHKILKGIVLRRTKKGRAADLALPPRIVSFYATVQITCTCLSLYHTF